MYEGIPRVVMPLGRVGPNGVNLLGTCFLLPNRGWFATASHVTENDDRNLVVLIPEEESLSNYQDTTKKDVKMINAKIIKTDPIHDTTIIEINADVNSTIKIGSLDSVSVNENVVLFGYPHANHGRKVLTSQTTTIGAKILLDNSGIKSKHAVVNIQTKPGQSGSPVFSIRNSSIVGILIGSYAPQKSGGISIGGIDPQTLHQTSHMVSAEYILRMIK
ncbi:S1 family peptidase [Sediminispirochaeta smaragdinae]|uniref:Peptidase S1 and S6 chymotrypsin/Hap n=1 Tax=Sediminispirochaeta smaragdinae (strain DSM 11293 / JCM 15392 / SEBR 4228) TaxID=573413 RepID=E1RB31_SEDSS|nr:serine protease [Sediminispirochaeta smaragdinae]ADK79561.1 conserved hypothetical protein [Sediminispirochaeta smaragdinae DSM 11293]